MILGGTRPIQPYDQAPNPLPIEAPVAITYVSKLGHITVQGPESQAEPVTVHVNEPTLPHTPDQSTT